MDKPISPESGKVCPQTDPKARDQMNRQVLKIGNKIEIKTSTILSEGEGGDWGVRLKL